MHWSTVTIGDYLVKTELRDPTKRPRDHFRYVDVSSVDNQAYAIRQPTELLGADAPSRARKVIRERDVLFATVRPTLRRIALVDSALDNQICSTGFCVLRTGPKLDAGFLYYRLLTDDVVAHVAKIEKGVSYPAIRDSDVKKIRIPYPPLDEQRQIAAVLSAVQRAIERQERLIALTAELKNALMNKLFTEGTRGEPLKQTEIGPVPRSWDVMNLGSCCTLATGTTPSTANPDLYRGKNAFIKTDQIVNARIAAANLFVSDDALARYGLKVFPPGTVLMAMYGQGKTRGQVGILDVYASITQNAAAIVCGESLVPDFLYFYLMSQYVRLRQSGFDGQISHLNLGFLRRLLIPRPQWSEQTQVAEALALVEAKEQRHRTMSLLLNQLFKSLLHQLMTAQVRVHDLDLSALEGAEQEPVGAV